MLRKLVFALPILVCLMYAQSPKFEVASIKPCPDSSGRKGGPNASPELLRLNCQTVMSLIDWAYVNFPKDRAAVYQYHQRIEGGPAWINSERYTIIAKAETPQSRATLNGPMLQALLEDRFKLKIRREKREIPIYALTVSKGGAKLQPSKPGSCMAFDRDRPSAPSAQPRVMCGFFRWSPANYGVDTAGQTMAGLCQQFSANLDREVVDETGLAGAFDIHLELSQADLSGRRDDGAPAPDSFPAIADAVSKLGLKLAPAKRLDEILVIDHVEKPSAN